MYTHRDLQQSPQPSQVKCRHFLRFFDNQRWRKTCTINGWTSGLKDLDKLIQKTQRKATKWTDNYLEWIDFDQFEDIKEIGEGAYSVVYEAIWLNGRRCKRKKGDKGRRCTRTEPIKVVLKNIKDSKNMSSYYLKNLKEYYRYSALICPQRIQNYLEFYGITQNPTSGEYMLVIQHATFGSLRQFMHSTPSTFASFKWIEKLWWLCDIVSNLTVIHKSRYIHGNLHTGNILQLGVDERETYSTIADLGLCIPANSISSVATCEKSLKGNNLVYGVLPFIAPEAFLGNPIRKRPQIPSALAPKRFRDLVQRCCDPDPLKRPTAKHLKYIFNHWYQCANGNLRHDSKCMKIMNEFLRADDQASILFQENRMFEQEKEMKEKTWFTSRLLNFKLNKDSIIEMTASTEIM
ncbi:7153_t:CDS:2 [Cetraspora pellucida]|uniref:7153_t:CDS:1 n=1 Tax=Cetraspora pellucida TaxID=1433469 RepID=A0A9N9EK07_9GLOM|nr:7153_t:CDS:2 [Cetraspora pellucida]